MVPAVAEALVDIRLMPGQPAEAVIDAVQQLIDAEIARRPGLSVTIDRQKQFAGRRHCHRSSPGEGRAGANETMDRSHLAGRRCRAGQ